MNTQIEKTAPSLKGLMEHPDMKRKFQDMLGERMQGFFVSVSNAVNNNKLLKNADPGSIMMAAGVAASLDLPIDPNLGFAYIVPYGGSASFQIGYRGLVQLAQRSGAFETLNVTDVREGEIGFEDFLTGDIQFNWKTRDERLKLPVIGYVAYFKLLNGFKKNLYMSKSEAESHGKRYSQTYKNNSGKWKDDFDAMAKKTVLKLLLSKYAPLSIQMQRAVVSDQGVVKSFDNETIDVEYVDNTESINIGAVETEKQKARIVKHINEATSLVQLEEVFDLAQENDLLDLYTAKQDELKK